MASSKLLQQLLGQSGMPSQQWWDDTESAYESMCQMLTEDINTGEQRNRTSRPMVVILPIGNHACKLSSRNELLNCVAFGTVRTDLFVEVAWQNITKAQDNGSDVKVYEATERRILLGVAGCKFSLQYVESPDLVRRFPAIVDVSRAFQEELQDEVDEIVETIRDLRLVTDHIEKDRSLSQVYYILRAWMVSSGLYQIDSGDQSLRMSKNSIACFNGDLLRELAWNVYLMNENKRGSEDSPARISNYFLCHQSCLESSKKDSCSFFDDSKGLFVRRWSDTHFWVAHDEFRALYAHLSERSGEEPDFRYTDQALHKILSILLSKPLLDRLPRNSYIRVTMQYSGQSQLAGTRMMQFAEERVLDLIHALEIPTKEENCLRAWPTRLVDMNAGENDHPYEGYWLIGINFDENVHGERLGSELTEWNEKIYVSHRYDPSTMVIYGDFVNRDALLQQGLKEDIRDWPVALAKPNPRYTLDQTTKAATNTTTILLSPAGLQTAPSPHKLRPALDVLSRLRHDPAFNLDDYVVGYTDRHAGIQEKAAGSWVSESTDEEFIPQGRIQFFKRLSDREKVWDRATKYDCVFR